MVLAVGLLLVIPAQLPQGSAMSVVAAARDVRWAAVTLLARLCFAAVPEATAQKYQAFVQNETEVGLGPFPQTQAAGLIESVKVNPASG